MGKQYYLIGGFQINDHITDRTSCWRRLNLVGIPELLQYEEIVDQDQRIYYYINSIGTCIFIAQYGIFQNEEEMRRDYDFESSDTRTSVVDQCYAALVPAINVQFKISINDTDWYMPLYQGEFSVENSTVSIHAPLFEENEEFVALIDCSMIYQSVSILSIFFKSLMLKDNLNRYEQYQISYYVQSLNIIQNPTFFLTNTNEIYLCHTFYQEWKLEEQISIVIHIADKSVSLFSFLADYKSKNKNSIFNILLPYFSFVLSYDSIMGLLLWFFPESALSVTMLMRMMLMIGTVFAFVLIGNIMYQEYKQNKLFTHKTRR